MYYHLNSIGLIQEGFKRKAIYECFKKGEPKLTIECWQKGNNYYLVRIYSRTIRCWDTVHATAKEANERVVALWETYSFHKRIL